MNKLDFILLIDDDEATSVFHQIMAEESGVTANIFTAASAESAISQLQQLKEQFNLSNALIFLDINMPATDGWGFLELIEESDLPQPLHIIMVSASDHPRDLDRIQSHPLLKGFEPKPITAEKIIFWSNRI